MLRQLKNFQIRIIVETSDSSYVPKTIRMSIRLSSRKDAQWIDRLTKLGFETEEEENEDYIRASKEIDVLHFKGDRDGITNFVASTLTLHPMS